MSAQDVLYGSTETSLHNLGSSVAEISAAEGSDDGTEIEIEDSDNEAEAKPSGTVEPEAANNSRGVKRGRSALSSGECRWRF